MPCLICDNKFKGDTNLLIHQRQFHTVTVLRSIHYCGECKTNFTSKLEYTEHQNLKCDRCVRSFCQNDNLKVGTTITIWAKNVLIIFFTGPFGKNSW